MRGINGWFIIFFGPHNGNTGVAFNWDDEVGERTGFGWGDI